MRVLVVEDDSRMRVLLKRGLEEEAHAVDAAATGDEGWALMCAGGFDAIVLDVMLPDADGFSLLRRLRAGRDHTPVILLTARDATADVVKGLDAGADDYLTKPFAFEELLARLRAAARRGGRPQVTRLEVADLVLDPEARMVERAGRRLDLTHTEYRLLEYLLRRAGHVLPRERIIDAVWGAGQAIESNTLDAFVSLLRRKVDAGFQKPLIHTVRYVGYVVREDA